MRLQEIAFKCASCCVYFTPNADRAKRLMKQQGYISLCKECEEEGRED